MLLVTGLHTWALNHSRRTVIGNPGLRVTSKDSFPPSRTSQGWSHFCTARPYQSVSCSFTSLWRFHNFFFFFLAVWFLSAKEDYSQQVSAASFEWLVNMSMCEQRSCLTSAVLMKQLQMEKRALEGLWWLNAKSQTRKISFPCIKGSEPTNRPSFSPIEATHIPFL